MLKKIQKDNWRPRYGNDSRPWLVNSGDCVFPQHSTMEEQFVPETNVIGKKEGIRKKMLRQFFWQEMSEEMFKELTADETKSIKDDSEYKDSFKVEGFDGKPQKSDPEMHKKYPLYSDTPRTIWYDKFSSLPGTTLPPNKLPKDVFRRTTTISKSIDEF